MKEDKEKKKEKKNHPSPKNSECIMCWKQIPGFLKALFLGILNS